MLKTVTVNPNGIVTTETGTYSLGPSARNALANIAEQLKIPSNSVLKVTLSTRRFKGQDLKMAYNKKGSDEYWHEDWHEFELSSDKLNVSIPFWNKQVGLCKPDSKEALPDFSLYRNLYIKVEKAESS